MGCGPGHIPYGTGSPYDGFTTKDLIGLLKTLDQSILTTTPGMGAITSASVNGKTFTFSTSSSAASDPFSAISAKKVQLSDWINFCENGVWPPNRSRAIGVVRLPYYATPNPCPC